MSSEKFKVSKTDRSARHATKNFFGTFSVAPNGFHSTTTTTTISYPLVGVVGGIDSIHEDPESHLDRRSAHNALERQRREILNAKFQELAHALPALQTVRRPSKTMIVAKSLDYVGKSMQRETNYINQIKDLRKQNERLRKQAKISKALMVKHQQSSGMKKKIKSSSSSSSSSENLPTTPPLSSKHSSLLSCAPIHQQMSPPLTPEAPNKQYTDMKPTQASFSSPFVDPNWSDSMGLMNYCPSSQPSTLDENALMTMMMLPQWPVHHNTTDHSISSMMQPCSNYPHQPSISSQSSMMNHAVPVNNSVLFAPWHHPPQPSQLSQPLQYTNLPLNFA